MLWDHRPGQNRFAGIVLQEYSATERKLIGERQLIFTGHAARLHRSAAPLQAQRLLLPAHRRRRHGWGHAVTMARSRDAARALRTASRHLHPDRAPSSGRRAAARRPRRSRRDAERRDLHGLSLRPAAAQSRPLHARPRDGDSANDLVGRRLAAHDWTATGMPTLETSPRPRLPAHPFPADARARGLRRRRSCRSTSSGCARRGRTSSSA